VYSNALCNEIWSRGYWQVLVRTGHEHFPSHEATQIHLLDGQSGYYSKSMYWLNGERAVDHHLGSLPTWISATLWHLCDGGAFLNP
jgi:hypothetical protein